MDMIFVSSNLKRITFKIFTNSTDIIEQLITDFIIDQWLPVLCTENDVDIDFNYGLAMPLGNDCDIAFRVAPFQGWLNIHLHNGTLSRLDDNALTGHDIVEK